MNKFFIAFSPTCFVSVYNSKKWSGDNYFGDSAVSKILVTRCLSLLFPAIAAKVKTTSEAMLTATSKAGCSFIPGKAFSEDLEANGHYR